MTARRQPTRHQLEQRLDDWAIYAREQNGDLDSDAWAAIDALLDQYSARLREPPEPPYAPIGNPEFMPTPRAT